MKKLIAIISLAIICSCSPVEEKTKETQMHADHSQTLDKGAHQPKSKSPKQMTMTTIEGNHIHIEYHSPSMRGRKIFGGLVAYNEVWVTGAHNATSISFTKDLEISGKKIEAGKYALFTIPDQKEWTVIINKNWEQHLADDYKQEEDILRFKVIPTIVDTPRESLTYKIENLDDLEGELAISWENLAIKFIIKNI